MQRLVVLLARLEGADDAGAAQALAGHFAQPLPPADALISALLLAGRRGPRLLDDAALRALGQMLTGLPPWLWDHCEQEAGGALEALAHAWPAGDGAAPGLAAALHALRAMAGLDAAARRDAIGAMLGPLTHPQRRLLLQLATGSVPARLAPALLHRGLAQAWHIDATRVALRLDHLAAGRGWPAADGTASSLGSPAPDEDAQLPMPFRPWRPMPWPESAATPVAGDAAGGCWARPWPRGQRVQCVARAGRLQLWSESGQWCSPWLRALEAPGLADAVLEGHWDSAPGAPALLVHDLLRWQGVDLAMQPSAQRQERLQALALPSWMAMAPAPQPLATRSPGQWQHLARQKGWQGLLVGREPVGDEVQAWPLPRLQGLAQVAYLEWPTAAGQAPAFELAVWSRAPSSAAEVDAVEAASRGGQRPAPGALALLSVGRTAQLGPGLDAAVLLAAARDHAVARFGPVQALRPGLAVRIRFDALVPNRRRRSGCELAGVAIEALVPAPDVVTLPTLSDLRQMASAAADPDESKLLAVSQVVAAIRRPRPG
ncbi:MAG: hypothetical protein ACKVQR_00590 [Aquabacterium sp.]